MVWVVLLCSDLITLHLRGYTECVSTDRCKPLPSQTDWSEVDGADEADGAAARRKASCFQLDFFSWSLIYSHCLWLNIWRGLRNVSTAVLWLTHYCLGRLTLLFSCYYMYISDDTGSDLRFSLLCSISSSVQHTCLRGTNKSVTSWCKYVLLLTV